MMPLVLPIRLTLCKKMLIVVPRILHDDRIGDRILAVLDTVLVTILETVFWRCTLGFTSESSRKICHPHSILTT